MYPAYQAHSQRGSPPPSPQQNKDKVMLQREYREKEGECFNTLRDLIKELTGEELRTRQEILRKTIDILTASETEKRGQTQADTPVPYQASSPANLENTASTHAGHFTQSAHYPQSGQSNANFNAVYPYYGAHVQNQQYHDMSGADSAFNPAGYPGYGENFDYHM